MTGLEAYGWRSALLAHLSDEERADLRVGRVIRQRGELLLATAGGTIRARPSGRLKFEAASPGELPAVGDWVVFLQSQGEGESVVDRILPRSSAVVRKSAGLRTDEQVIAANVDVAFLVTGLDDDINPRRIERYLVLAHESGALPVVILNKADLWDDTAEIAGMVRQVAMNIPVHVISALRGEGLDMIRPYLGPGVTAVLLGSSGAGKSTILNVLAGEPLQMVREVRLNDSRGRHTTSTRELFLLEGGAMVIDTPGLREIQLWTSPAEVAEAFPDITDLARLCRFNDCRHGPEPGCAVREAIGEGRLDEGRFESYQKLLREAAYLSRRQDERARREEKERVKRITAVHKRSYRR